MHSSALSPHRSASNLLAQKRRTPRSGPGSGNKAVLSFRENVGSTSDKSVGHTSGEDSKNGHPSPADKYDNGRMDIRKQASDDSSNGSYPSQKSVSFTVEHKLAHHNTPPSRNGGALDTKTDESLMSNPLRNRAGAGGRLMDDTNAKLGNDTGIDLGRKDKSHKKTGPVIDYGGIYSTTDEMDAGPGDNREAANGSDAQYDYYFGTDNQTTDFHDADSQSGDVEDVDSDDSSEGGAAETEAALLLGGDVSAMDGNLDLLEAQRADWLDYITTDSCDPPGDDSSVQAADSSRRGSNTSLVPEPATKQVENDRAPSPIDAILQSTEKNGETAATQEAKNDDSASKLISMGFQPLNGNAENGSAVDKQSDKQEVLQPVVVEAHTQVQPESEIKEPQVQEQISDLALTSAFVAIADDSPNSSARSSPQEVFFPEALSSCDATSAASSAASSVPPSPPPGSGLTLTLTGTPLSSKHGSSGPRLSVNFGSIYEGDMLDAEQIFLEAALSNDVATMQPLLDAHTTSLVLCKNEEGQNALMLACKAGALDVVSWLAPFYAVDSAHDGLGFNSNRQQGSKGSLYGVDNFGRTYLHLCKDEHSVSCICENVFGINPEAGSSRYSSATASTIVNAIDVEGLTPLLTYALSDNLECIRALLVAVPTVDLGAVEPTEGRSCLHIAADHGNADIVHAIVNHCAKLGNGDVALVAGESPLLKLQPRLWSNNGRFRSVSEQLCMLQDNDGNTALHLAVSTTALQPSQPSSSSTYSTATAAAAGGVVDSGRGSTEDSNDDGVALKNIMLLLNAGSDPNARNGRGVTALHFLCANSALHTMALPVLEVFCALGADCNIADFDGCTPLLVACAYRQWPLCEFLLRQGGDLNQPCSINSPFLRSGSDTLRQARRKSSLISADSLLMMNASAAVADEAASSDGYTSFADYDMSSAVHNPGGSVAGAALHPEAYCTASDLTPKAPRLRLFRCITAPQTRIPGETRDRCMQCAGDFSGKDSANFYSMIGLVTGRHHCRLCQRVICSNCSIKEIPRSEVPDFVAAATQSSMVRVCNVCYAALTDDTDDMVL